MKLRSGTFSRPARFIHFLSLLILFSCLEEGALKATSPQDSFPDSRALQKEDYTVRDVNVDITAKSAYEARSKAIKEAGLKGFQKLLSKLTTPEDRSCLSKDSPADIEDYIETFEVSKEKISRVRYLASFSVSFKPHKVKSLFARHGLTPTLQLPETPKEVSKLQNLKPALIMPVLVDSDKTLLWDERNPWFTTWSASDQGETSFVVPVGDLKDVRDLSAEAAKAGAIENIARLLERYNLEQGFVGVLEVMNSGKPVLTISQYSKDGLLRKAEAVSFDPAGSLEATVSQAHQKMKSMLLSFMGSFDTLARLSDVSARVSFSTLKEWHFIREKLELFPVVKDISVHSLKRSGAEVTLKIIGTLDGFLSLLKDGEIQGEKQAGAEVVNLKRAPITPAHNVLFPAAPGTTEIPLYQGEGAVISSSSSDHKVGGDNQKLPRSSGGVE